MNTLRDLDLALLETEQEAEKMMEKFLTEFYGKRPRPDKLTLPPEPPPMPELTLPEQPNGNLYG